MLRLFFDLKIKQGQRADLVTGVFQQYLHFTARAGLETCQVQKCAPREKGRSLSIG